MTKQEEIQRLKAEKDAAILAHFYVAPEIQEAADYIGDSFKLSRIAKDLPNQTIVFCGVSFMGESGKLLSPGKRILMPAPDADCPMAHMVTRQEVERARKQYPDLAVVCYVNSTAEIKSWSDVCVTSANAVKIVKNLPNRNILFIPIHEGMKAQEIEALKKERPKAEVLAHPECNEDVLAMADYIGSTSGILAYAKESGAEEFIIGTEIGVLHELKKQNPGKRFFVPATPPVCHDMKKITLDHPRIKDRGS